MDPMKKISFQERVEKKAKACEYKSIRKNQEGLN
jgi:hypothetical protein